MASAGAWLGLIVGLILGVLFIIAESNEKARWSYEVYNDEDNFMEDMEEWILVEDLEEDI